MSRASFRYLPTHVKLVATILLNSPLKFVAVHTAQGHEIISLDLTIVLQKIEE